jgi:hypothetical protein
MEGPQQTQTLSPTPEELLKLLDLQLAQERAKRSGKSRNRASFLAAGILFIIAVAGVALFFAQGLLLDLQDREMAPPIPGQMGENQ